MSLRRVQQHVSSSLRRMPVPTVRTDENLHLPSACLNGLGTYPTLPLCVSSSSTTSIGASLIPLVRVVPAPPESAVVPLFAVNTRKEFRQWKQRRKRDGGRNRGYRLKYG
mmetsp:Transcript_2339/g.6753  ORF Transcript_2339/g.6753 Transcript_2339/m.6753 type:complete len:110 (-) Transcript_2339:83-412(-)